MTYSQSTPPGIVAYTQPGQSLSDERGHMLDSYLDPRRHRSHMTRDTANTRHPGWGNCAGDTERHTCWKGLIWNVNYGVYLCCTGDTERHDCIKYTFTIV